MHLDNYNKITAATLTYVIFALPPRQSAIRQKLLFFLFFFFFLNLCDKRNWNH